MRVSGKSRKEVLEGFEREEEGEGSLPSLEGLVQEGDRRRSKRVKVKREVVLVDKEEVEKSDDDESEDELMRQLDELIGVRSVGGEGEGRDVEMKEKEKEEGGVGDGEEEEEEEEEEAKWNIGKLMKVMGVDPALFGWNEEDEEFAG